MSMAKTSKQVSLNIETKAADILYDSAQKCDLSLTAFFEHVAYAIATEKRERKDSMLFKIVNSKEPDN